MFYRISVLKNFLVTAMNRTMFIHCSTSL